METRYREEQVVGFLREASDYGWNARFGGMSVSDAQRPKALEAENGKVKGLLANSMPEVDAMHVVLEGRQPPWRRVARSSASRRPWA